MINISLGKINFRPCFAHFLGYNQRIADLGNPKMGCNPCFAHFSWVQSEDSTANRRIVAQGLDLTFVHDNPRIVSICTLRITYILHAIYTRYIQPKALLRQAHNKDYHIQYRMQQQSNEQVSHSRNTLGI